MKVRAVGLVEEAGVLLEQAAKDVSQLEEQEGSDEASEEASVEGSDPE